MALPPLGQTAGRDQEIIDHLDGLARESRDDRVEWDDVVQRSMNIFVYGDDQPPDPDKITVPKIQDAVVAISQTQVQQEPTVAIEPVETGEPPEFYWAGPPEEGYAIGLPVEYVEGFIGEDGTLQSPLPLPTRYAEELKALAAPPEKMPVLPPGMIRPEWICELDDRCCADVLQSVFDVLWVRSEVAPFLRKAVYLTNIRGTYFALYQFDDDDQQYVFRVLPFQHVHIDPTAATIKDAAYAGFDLPMDADQAKAFYPELAEMIGAHASTGTLIPPDVSIEMSAQYTKKFERPMVWFRVFWIRNQPQAMSEDEALGAGIIEQREVPDEQFAGGAADFGVPSTGDLADDPVGFDESPDALLSADVLGGGSGDGADSTLDNPGAEQEQVDPAAPDSLGAAGGSGDSFGSGVPDGQPAAVAALQPTRSAYFHAGTDTEVTPPFEDETGQQIVHQHWPVKLCIRQITLIDRIVVSDEPSQYKDIPILHNVNIPLPTERPWGISEPMRLRPLQRALSRNVDSMVEQGDFAGKPVSTMSRSMYNALGGTNAKARAQPGQVNIVEDDVFIRFNGKIETVQDPPQLSAASVQLTPMLSAMIDESSGNTPTLRGTPTSADASGAQVRALQSSGTAIMQLKAQGLGDMLYRTAHEMLHSIRTRLTVDDVLKIVSKYPRHVAEKIFAKWQALEWNIVPKVQAGAASMRAQKIAEVQVLLAMQLISPQTACEMLDVDYRVERQRKLADQQWLMSQTGVMPGQEGEQQGQQGQEEGPPNQGG